MAMTGESVRVGLKKDYVALVTEGQEAGFVQVDTEDSQFSIVLPAGKGVHSDHAALPYVLDAQRFAHMPTDDRRAFLFGLMGLRTDGAAVKERLTARGCDAKKVVLDRFDVLDLKGREDLLYWLDALAEDGEIDTALVFGTLKGQLANFVAYSPLAQPIRDGQQFSNTTQNSRRHLNPIFGAWLMGWPSTWVIAEPHVLSASATESWRSALRSHLSSFFDDLESHREAA